MKDRLSDVDEESMINRYLIKKEEWRCEHWDLKRFLEHNSTIFYVKLRERPTTYCDDFCFFVYDGEKLHIVNRYLEKIFSDFLRGTKKKRLLFGVGTSVHYNLSVLRIPYIIHLADRESLRLFGQDLSPLFNLVFKNIKLVEFNK